MTVVPYGTSIEGDGLPFDWLVGPDDKIIGVGRLNGIADCLVVISDWGMSVWALRLSGTPALVSIHENGTEFQGPDGRTWELDTTDPRFRLLGVSDIDMRMDRRDEMVLMSSSGLAILHENGSGGWDLKFLRHDGEPVFRRCGWHRPRTGWSTWRTSTTAEARTCFSSTRTASPSWARRISAPDSPWTFGVIAEHQYGSSVGGWELGEGDLLSSLAGDFDGDGQNDFPITDGQDLGILTISGSEFKRSASLPMLPMESCRSPARSSSLELAGSTTRRGLKDCSSRRL